jgi:membrane associated rhomboid family serine protease
MVGASGAISGILGAYLVLFPFARVKTLVFLGFLITIIRIPAIVLLVIWILIQVFSGIVAGDGSIAWFAHIGGFVTGMLFILPFQDIKH